MYQTNAVDHLSKCFHDLEYIGQFVHEKEQFDAFGSAIFDYLQDNAAVCEIRSEFNGVKGC